MDLSHNEALQAVEIVRTLRQAGHAAYFAGGCVRDLLLGRPAQDIDIATGATPNEIERCFARVVPVGKAYGVVCVILDNRSFEVATFRKDLDYHDGRHPSGVEFADARQDSLRRDFTINGMFLDPLEHRIIDYVGGQEDLRTRTIRTIGNPRERFSEDRLRLLRAIRFACHLDFQIDPETAAAIAPMAYQILEVSWERIRDELVRMLTAPAPARALDLLQETDLLRFCLPEVWALQEIEQPPQFHPEGDVFVHTRRMLELASRPTPTLALGILCHDLGKPLTFEARERIRFDLHAEIGCLIAEDLCTRLRLTSEETERIVELVRHHLRFMHVESMRPSTLKRFLRLPYFDEHLELHRLDCLGSHGDLTSWHFCRSKMQQLTQEEIAPPPLLRGRDLIDMGLSPGPLFGNILRALEDAQLEGVVHTREEAIAWVSNRYGSGI